MLATLTLALLLMACFLWLVTSLLVDTGYIQDSGVTDVLNAWTNLATCKFKTANLHLFEYSSAVDDSTTLATLSATEASFPGYSAVPFTSATWGAVTVGSHVATTTVTAAQTFTCTGGSGAQTVYGAYFTDSGNTVLLAAYVFAAGPYTMVNNGDQIATTPVLTCQSVY